MKLSGTERTYQSFVVTVVVLTSVVSTYPIFYVVALSLTSELEWVQRNGLVLWPTRPTLRAYISIFRGTSVILNSFGISVARTAVGTFLNLLFVITTGYILSRRRLPGRRFLIAGVLLTILFPGGLIPTFLIVRDTGLVDTFWAMVIPTLIHGWYVLVCKQFFENLPLEIEESALMDGASELTLMARIFVPMSLPVIAALGLFAAVNHWNQWFDALVYIRRPELMPLQLILRNIFANTNIGYEMNSLTSVDPSQRVSSVSIRMAVTVIGTAPILMIYPFLQKHFAKGVYVGAVKG